MSSIFEPYPVSLVHQLIEPGPTVMITTGGDQWPTIMTNGFNMPVRHDGTLAVVVGPWDTTYETLRRVGECVIAVPDTGLLETTVDVGNASSAQMNKWEHFGLTQLPASTIEAPLIGECVANIECAVEDDTLVDAYDLWILRARAAWLRPDAETPEFHHRGNGTFTENGQLHDLRDRMTKWQHLT
ncbi:flavin reductase family protein [Nesterenkonia sp. PF2B19]|uniref:flavin reductase family protein n=1 Tax=Nesterenkonia sp. PF2B19 TaxID=1881858 RepID=UPI000872ADAD|nr:flavin reductase family protein [Nesterenkonia sp. PF2B19]